MNNTNAIESIMDYFKEINKIPRCSKHEDKIADYLVKWAKSKNFETKKDKYNNVVICVPATDGYKNKDSIAIQGHMDMVCEKTRYSKHDFSKDPIDVIIDGDWAKAKDTTLGADDGIALAIGLALASDNTLKHPEIELLFTSDEETGLNGAKKLEPGFFKSKKLINIDSETEGVFTVGCAGGEDTDIMFPLQYGQKDGYFYEIKIYGLLGGHSGGEINKNRANAIKLIVNIIKKLQEYEPFLCYIEGGSARNAIPKNAEAVIRLKKQITPNIIGEFYKDTLENYPEETGLKIEFQQLDEPKQIFLNSQDILNILEKLPHGVYETENKNTVKTSNNLAKVQTKGDFLRISTNQRSLTKEGLDTITGIIENIAEKYNAEYISYNRYPSWQPDYNSAMLKKSVEIYEKLFSKKPEISVIHGGLECGIIGSKNDKIDMISIGPTIEDVHTPNEKLYIPSLEKVWKLLTNMLQEI